MDLAQKKGILDSLRDLRLRAHIKISTLKWLRAKFLTKESQKQHKDCRYHSGSIRRRPMLKGGVQFSARTQ